MNDDTLRWIQVATLYRQDHMPLCKINMQYDAFGKAGQLDDRRCNICKRFDELYGKLPK